MYVIDSNIWAYYFDKTTPEHPKVSPFLDELIKKHEIVVTNIIAVEVIHFLFRRLGPDKGREKAKIFQLGNFEHVDFTFEDIISHIELMKKNSNSGLGGRDVSIIVCMKKNNLKNLVTHDKKFRNLTNIKVLDPIIEDNNLSNGEE